MKITVRIDESGGRLDEFPRQVIHAAAYRAIGRTVDGVVTDISREARRTYNIKKSDIDPRMKKIKPSSYYDMKGMVILNDGERSNLPLMLFGAVERRNLAKGSAKTLMSKGAMQSLRMKNKIKTPGVSYRVLKSGGKGFSGNAFILPGGRGSWQVVRRVKGIKGDAGLKEKRVLSVANMVASMKHGVLNRIEAQAQARLNKNFDHDLDYYMKQWERGLGVGTSKGRFLRRY